MNKVFIGLGTNVGNKIENISKVVQFFQSDEKFQDVKSSSLYESKPYGYHEQDNFLNSVISFSTNISSGDLLKITKELEKIIGRTKTTVWGPREIDIDILLYGEAILKSNSLSIPHKDLLNRDFVIVPLLELDEEVIHPVEKKKIKLFLSDLEDKYIIDKINFSLSD